MNEVTKSKLKEDGHRLDGASLEKTIAYETEQGVVTEKTTLNFKHDSGNVIDKTINEVRSSEYVKKAGSTTKNAFSAILKLALTLGVIGFVLLILAVMAGVIS